MTNKEIKLELAKSLIANPKFLPTDETLRNLFSWIIESDETNTDKELETAKESETEYSTRPIGEILSHMAKTHEYCGRVCGSLETVLHNNNICTVGDLLGIGRLYFKRYGHVGEKSISGIDEALEELYGIKSW